MDAAWQGAAVEEGNLSVQIASLRRLLGPVARRRRLDRDGSARRLSLRGSRRGARRRVRRRQALGARALDRRAALHQPQRGQPSQQYFAEGLAEDIITRLARLRWLFVAARTSSFTYGGTPVNAQRVGRDLGVRYVLDGSVRRSGQHLRIGAELSDAATGLQVWTDRYDADVADFFALQDQIAESVIAAIEPRLYAAEHQRFRSRVAGHARRLGLRHAGDALCLYLGAGPRRSRPPRRCCGGRSRSIPSIRAPTACWHGRWRRAPSSGRRTCARFSRRRAHGRRRRSDSIPRIPGRTLPRDGRTWPREAPTRRLRS